MTPKSFKGAYSRFSAETPGTLHFAAHSHHLWPDCTFDAHAQYWRDSARLQDTKWEKIFGEVLPEAAVHLAELLGTGAPDRLAFAPNTHEFVLRLFSLFTGRSVRVLTTDSEFHSFDRQARRYQELGQCEVVRVAVEPSETFAARFRQAMHKGSFDLIFISHVFFTTGAVVADLRELVEASDPRSVWAVDGYHAVGAVEVDLGELHDRIFYLGGGYKYLQAGEGAAYLHVPLSCALDPANTGWMAAIERLDAEREEKVFYPSGASRFLGATFDPSGWYRFNAVMRWWKEAGLNVSLIRDHRVQLQEQLLEQLDSKPAGRISRSTLLSPSEPARRGAFLSFDLGSSAEASSWVERLAQRKVTVDSRGSLLRLGFGLYHDTSDVEVLHRHLQHIAGH